MGVRKCFSFFCFGLCVGFRFVFCFVFRNFFGIGRVQATSAVFAEFGVVLMAGTVAVGTFFVSSALVIFHHRSRYDTRRHGDDGVTDKHHAGGKELSQTGGGSNVSVAYGSHGDDGPVNAVRDIIELGIGLRTFNHVHQCPDGCHQNDDKQEEYRNLFATLAKGGEQPFAFVQEVEQLEYTEHPYQPESAYDKQVACTGEK